MKNLFVNNSQKLYVLNSGNGYNCLGFDVCFNKATKLNIELNTGLKIARRGSKKLYSQYQKLVSIVRKKYLATGYRSNADLIPEFIGNEGKKVEVITNTGDTERFIIGKSTGWIPSHLMIKTKRSIGGGSVYGHPFKSIRFI